MFQSETADDSKDGRFVLTRDGLADKALTVSVSVSESGADFVPAATEAAAQTLTFTADQAVISYTPVSATQDPGGHGTVTVAVQDGTGYAPLASAATATAQHRDDTGQLLAVTIDPAAVTVAEGANATFTVRAANADRTLTSAAHLERVFGKSAVDVLVASADDTATAPADYSAIAADTPLVLRNFSATPDGGAWSAQLSTATVTDETNENPDEQFTVGVTLPTGTDSRIALGTPNTATVTLVEGPVVTLTLSSTDLGEGDVARVSATVAPVHNAAFTVELAAVGAGDRVDFPDGTTLSFGPNAAAPNQTLRLRAVVNDLDEPDLVDVELKGKPSTLAVGSRAVTFGLRDDDLPEVSIAAPADAAELDGFLYEEEAVAELPGRYWLLTRRGQTAEDLTVGVRVSETGIGGDFATDGPAEVTFLAGRTMVSYTPVTSDSVDEAPRLGLGPGYGGGGFAVPRGCGRIDREAAGARRRRHAADGVDRLGGDGERGQRRGVRGDGGQQGRHADRGRTP